MALIFLLHACGSPAPAPTTGPTTYIRKNASKPEAAADLAALNVAMAKMKQMPCDSVQSWYYQGAIHSMPMSVPNGNPLCPSYTTMAQMKTAWMNCTHDPMGASEMHFLLWHRLYIWHFEKIIRELSGKKDFALPYWDYTETQYRVMPEIFRNPKDSLYESARLASLNAGEPIQPFMNRKLDMTKNDECTIYSVFNSQVDQAPHGAMHNYVGGGYAGDSTLWNRIYQGPNYGLMAQVESAGFDPIFFVHHANIDYLWERWYQSPNGAQPNLDSLLLQPWAYVFFNPDGKKVVYSIQDAFKQAFNMDYQYDVLQDTVKPPKVKTAVPENRKEIASLVLDHPVTKAAHPVPLALANVKQNLLQGQDMSRKATIMILTVGFKQQPRFDYEVYVDTDKPDDSKLAGHLTFFGAMHMKEPAPEYTKTFTFDITKEFDVTKLNNNFKLLIVNSMGQPANEISVKKVKIETRDF